MIAPVCCVDSVGLDPHRCNNFPGTLARDVLNVYVLPMGVGGVLELFIEITRRLVSTGVRFSTVYIAVPFRSKQSESYLPTLRVV